MNILFILDPLEKLEKGWDNSLHLLKALWARGHENWIAQAEKIQEGLKVAASPAGVQGLARKKAPSFEELRQATVSLTEKPALLDLETFDLILIRKDPPFDETYRRLTYALEPAVQKIPVVNHPRGIRNTNEKMGILNFPDLIPKTIISNSPETILLFQRQIDSDLVIKPLYEKGGKGVFLLKQREAGAQDRLKAATAQGKSSVVAQEFIPLKKDRGDKRIVLLNGEILAAYEKEPAPGEFRSNLSLGGTQHATEITREEKKLVEILKPYLLEQGLYFVGLDVLEGKLLEINVTSPAGITEAEELAPERRLVEVWADSLEDFVRKFGE